MHLFNDASLQLALPLQLLQRHLPDPLELSILDSIAKQLRFPF